MPLSNDGTGINVLLVGRCAHLGQDSFLLFLLLGNLLGILLLNGLNLTPELTHTLQVSVQGVSVGGLLVDTGFDGEVLGVFVDQLNVLGTLGEHGFEIVPEVLVLGTGGGGWDDRGVDGSNALLNLDFDLLFQRKDAGPEVNGESTERLDVRVGVHDQAVLVRVGDGDIVGVRVKGALESNRLFNLDNSLDLPRETLNHEPVGNEVNGGVSNCGKVACLPAYDGLPEWGGEGLLDLHGALGGGRAGQASIDTFAEGGGEE
mmetsp:Transcript_7195/g.14572  ORF Transcript_7195/g.14572 Transcript_7195/m.14572 type:complete len:260 (-) Transcript_7195:40-819(-)